MSLWTCPIHGLYGGDVFCPQCGGIGAYTIIASVDRSGRQAGETGSEADGLDPKDESAVTAKPADAQPIEEQPK